MAITKERKILMAAAGLACAVFLTDRVLMGGAMSGPQSADAASGALAAAAEPVNPGGDTPQAAIATTPAENTRPTPSAPVDSLAQRLDKARDALPAQTRDVFRPSAQWQTSRDAPAATSSGPAFDAQAFVRNNPLDAVFSASGQAQAMVGGRLVQLGETRDGLTLTEVGDRWVVWTGHGQQFKIHLDPKR
ncbi:MAG: hypothetical protein AAF333_01275 [Planctomycetota bacterium]